MGLSLCRTSLKLWRTHGTQEIPVDSQQQKKPGCGKAPRKTPVRRTESPPEMFHVEHFNSFGGGGSLFWRVYCFPRIRHSESIRGTVSDPASSTPFRESCSDWKETFLPAHYCSTWNIQAFAEFHCIVPRGTFPQFRVARSSTPDSLSGSGSRSITENPAGSPGGAVASRSIWLRTRGSAMARAAAISSTARRVTV